MVLLQLHAAVGALHDLDIFHVGRRGILHIRAGARILERIALSQQRTCRGAVDVQHCKRTAVQHGRAAALHIQELYPARPAGQVKRIARSYDHIRNLRAAADDQLISRIAVADIKHSADGLSVSHIQRQRFVACHIAARVFAAQRCDCAAGHRRFDREIQAALHIRANIAVGVICDRTARSSDHRRHRLSAGIAGPDAAGLRRAHIVGAGGSADRAHAVLFRPVVLLAGEAALTVRSPGVKRMLMRFDHQSHVGNVVRICGIRIGEKALVPGQHPSALVIAAQSERRTLGQIVRQVLALRDLQTVNQRRARFKRQIAALQNDRGIGDVVRTACRIAADHDRVSLYRHAATLDPDAVASHGGGIPLIECSVFQRHAAAGDGQRDAVPPYVRILADIGPPILSAQVNSDRAACDGDVFRHIPRQRHRAAVLGRFDGTGQRSVALTVVLRRQICTAGALFAVTIGLIKVVSFHRCRVAAHAALRAVGQPIGVGGAGQGVIFCLGRAAGARPGVGICIGMCPAVILVALRSFGLAAQLAHRRVRVAVIFVFPVMLKALLKGRATLAGGLLHFSGGCSYSARHTDGRRRQLTASGGLPEKVQCAACCNVHKAGDGQRCPVAQNQIDLAGNIEPGNRDILFYHMPTL